MGEAFDSASGTLTMATRSNLPFPKEKVRSGNAYKATNEFIVSYWAVGQAHDARLADVKKDMKQVPVIVGSDVFTINVPISTNPDGFIKAGSEIVVLKFDAHPTKLCLDHCPHDL